MASKIRIAIVAAVLAVGFVGLACSRNDTPLPTTPPAVSDANAAAPGGVNAPNAAANSPPAASESPPPYDSNQAMHDVFPGLSRAE
ncbi:MAG: hypothetical protein FI709_10190 [SAR202 cluster bacterium]|jgi:hypothetical protein|nr:hypothetical protein [SAR202 cluster bacterium]MDP6663583.1 hypothetical protein [SAR202 cluster bacterium]MDP6800246.1 hypothetical protein [SAR202 cluster bacterium]MQG58272.1 hypothetical protein [SAR202 cluster bacterium]